MKRILVAVAVLGSLTACTTTPSAKVNTTPNDSSTTTATSTSSASSIDSLAKVGQSITLTGNGTEVSATVAKVDVGAKYDDPYGVTHVPAGSVVVAVQLKIENKGSAAFSDNAMISAVLVDTDGQRYNPAISIDLSAGQELNLTFNVRPAGVVSGWIAFVVPKGTKVESFQYGGGLGSLSDVGEWQVS